LQDRVGRKMRRILNHRTRKPENLSLQQRFMVERKMCITVGNARIMCRIDPAIHDEALKRGGCTTVVMKGREYRGYVHVAADAVKTKRELDYWVGLALDFNSRAKPSARKRQE